MGLIEVGIDNEGGASDRNKVNWSGVIQSIRAKDDSGREVLVQIFNNEITTITFNAEEDDPDDHMVVPFETKWNLANLCKHLYETITGPIPEPEPEPVAETPKPIYKLARVKFDEENIKWYEFLNIRDPQNDRYGIQAVYFHGND